MSNKELFRIMLSELVCIRSRKACNKDCAECSCNVDLNEVDRAVQDILEILRARDPELYFVSSIEELKQLLP